MKNIGTSRLVFAFDSDPLDITPPLPRDLQEPSYTVEQPVTVFQAGGNGLGSYIEMAKRDGAYVFGARYTIVPNPHTGSGADTMQIYAWARNDSIYPVYAGLRTMLDVALIDNANDGAPISTDAGATVIDRNTLIQSITSSIPSDWWAYDQDPGPNLVARGVTWGNSFNLPATQPDAVEFCQWDQVAMPGVYFPHPDPGALFSSYTRPDSAVVLWYTNTGQATGAEYLLQPGQTLAWVTYYGLNQGSLGASPTPYATYTPSLSPTLTPTRTITLTPTPSISPTISPTFSISPTHSITPTHSVSPTISPTFSISPTHSVTPTVSPTPSVTLTPSLTATRSPSPSVSPTPSVTPPGCQTLVLTPRLPNPNPSNGRGVWLPYLLCRDAMVHIKVFDIAGELIREMDPFAARQGGNEQFWDQRNQAGALVASGIFLVQLRAVGGAQSSSAYMKLAVLR